MSPSTKAAPHASSSVSVSGKSIDFTCEVFFLPRYLFYSDAWGKRLAAFLEIDALALPLLFVFIDRYHFKDAVARCRSCLNLQNRVYILPRSMVENTSRTFWGTAKPKELLDLNNPRKVQCYSPFHRKDGQQDRLNPSFAVKRVVVLPIYITKIVDIRIWH